MKKEDIAKALTSVSEKYVEESRPAARRSRRWVWAVTAAAMIFAAVFGGYFGIRALINKGDEKTAVVDPTAVPITEPTAFQSELPTDVPYVKPPTGAAPVLLAGAEHPVTPGQKSGYFTFVNDLRKDGKFGAGKNLAEFYGSIQRELLSGGKNAVCSPYNIYMALAMLAEITEGSTRAQILNLLCADSIEDIRRQYSNLFDANYRYSEDIAVTLPDASIWLRDGYIYNADAIETLRDTYRASAGSGTMGDPAYDAMIEEWLNEATGNLLKESAHEAAKTDPMQILKLISTLYFKAQWKFKFNENAFYTDVFHGADGDREIEFMSGFAEVGWRFDNYTLAAKKLADGSVMWFALPDEGVSLESLIESGEPLMRILSGEASLDEEHRVYLNMPKLDVQSYFSLEDSLKRLGVTDCFNSALANFSPLTDDSLWVSEVTHASRLIADGDGVEAAAFTVIDVMAGGIPSEPDTTVTLDRPFMFLLMSADNTPLFTGTVYNAGE